MMKIKKGYNLKVIAIITSITFLFTVTLYSYPDSKDTLRVPVGQKSVYRKVLQIIRKYTRSNKTLSNLAAKEPQITESAKEKIKKLLDKIFEAELINLEINALNDAVVNLKHKVEQLSPEECYFVFEQWPFTIVSFKELEEDLTSPCWQWQILSRLDIISTGIDLALKAYREAPVLSGTDIRVINDFIADYIVEPHIAIRILRSRQELELSSFNFPEMCERLDGVMRHIRDVSPKTFKSIQKYTKVISLFCSPPGTNGITSTDPYFPGLMQLNITTDTHEMPEVIAHENKHNKNRTERLFIIAEDLVKDRFFMFPGDQWSDTTSKHTPVAYMSEISAELSGIEYYIDSVSFELKKWKGDLANCPITNELESIYQRSRAVESMLRPLELLLEKKQILTNKGEDVVKELYNQVLRQRLRILDIHYKWLTGRLIQPNKKIVLPEDYLKDNENGFNFVTMVKNTAQDIEIVSLEEAMAMAKDSNNAENRIILLKKEDMDRDPQDIRKHARSKIMELENYDFLLLANIISLARAMLTNDADLIGGFYKLLMQEALVSKLGKNYITPVSPPNVKRKFIDNMNELIRREYFFLLNSI